MGRNEAFTKPDHHYGPALRRGILAFCAIYLLVQIAVPLARLPNPNNKPFGWQMYSAISHYTFSVRTAGGSTERVNPRDYVLRYRADVDYRPYLPQLLCERVQGAVAVTAKNPLTAAKREYPCP
ncbi:MAG TPA: hypothetical protein VHJ78_05630 [Actinomycetota bacterium]|nr:hypothetical protein [Actinomycetota bacterium]